MSPFLLATVNYLAIFREAGNWHSSPFPDGSVAYDQRSDQFGISAVAAAHCKKKLF